MAPLGPSTPNLITVNDKYFSLLCSLADCLFERRILWSIHQKLIHIYHILNAYLYYPKCLFIVFLMPIFNILNVYLHHS